MYPSEDLLKKLAECKKNLDDTNETGIDVEVIDLVLTNLIDALTDYFNFKQKPFMGGMSNPGMGSGQG